MIRKTLTLKQPWASLVSYGFKKMEFRSWKTNYRGEILIHAGSSIDKSRMKDFEELNIPFPHKKIMAEVEILDCIKIDKNFNEKIKNMNNIVYGKAERTGYAWILGNCKLLDCNIEVKGKLGLWNFEYNIE